MALGDAQRDREAVASRTARGATRGNERGDRAGQARPVVADLDPDPTALDGRAHAHLAPAVLGGVGHEVAERLREPQAVGAHERGRAWALDPQPRAVRAGDRRPAGGRRRHEPSGVQHLEPLACAPPPRRGLEVLERETGAAQLELHSRRPPCHRLRRRLERVQAQARRAQRAAQLVRRLGDEREPPALPAPHEQGGGQRGGGQRPAGGGEQGRGGREEWMGQGGDHRPVASKGVAR